MAEIRTRATEMASEHQTDHAIDGLRESVCWKRDTDKKKTPIPDKNPTPTLPDQICSN